MLLLLYLLPLAVLGVRAAASGDAKWKRFGAGLVAVAALFGPMYFGDTYAPNRYMNPVAGYAIVVASLYLLLWSFLTRDPLSHRIVSVFAALAALLPIAVGILAMANYHE